MVVATACALVGTAAIISSFAATPSTISGTMWQDANRNGVVDMGELPFADKRINLYSNTGTYLTSTSTDSSGRFQFIDLAEGQYSVALDTPTWWELRLNWAPTTGNSIKKYSKSITLSGTAVADIGLREIIKSTDINAPISRYTAASGLKVASYNDVVTAQQVYETLTKGVLLGGAESNLTTVDFGLYGGNVTSASVNGGNPGLYYDYSATSYVSYESWLDDEDRTLFHEYGHAWSLYYAYIVHQDPTMAEYQKIRGIYGNPKVNSSYEWQVNEIIAEDYRQLFGSPTAMSGTSQMNTEIPLATTVPGLKDYLSGLFITADKSAPTAPTNLTAVSEDQSKVKLTWSASQDNLGVTGYDIYRSGSSSKVSTVSGTTTTYTDTNLMTNTTYSYYVIARDAAGNSSPASNTATAKTLSQPPSAPTALKQTAVTSNSVSMSWTPSTDNVAVTAYDVYRDNSLVGSVNSPSTSYFDSGLLPSSTHSYYVKARDAAGNTSSPSNTLTITTASADTQAPTAPTNFKASSILGTSVTLSWAVSRDTIGVTGYRIYKTGSSTPIKTVTTTSTTITGLTPNTQYSFYVTAVDAAGNQSPASNTVKIRTARK